MAFSSSFCQCLFRSLIPEKRRNGKEGKRERKIAPSGEMGRLRLQASLLLAALPSFFLQSPPNCGDERRGRRETRKGKAEGGREGGKREPFLRRSLEKFNMTFSSQGPFPHSLPYTISFLRSLLPSFRKIGGAMEGGKFEHDGRLSRKEGACHVARERNVMAPQEDPSGWIEREIEKLG